MRRASEESRRTSSVRWVVAVVVAIRGGDVGSEEGVGGRRMGSVGDKG